MQRNTTETNRTPGASSPSQSQSPGPGQLRAGRASPALIKDVAKRAGVSTATVSRVINTPDVVSPETASRVREAMSDLSYRPNMVARGLITRSTNVLGIVLPDFHGEFYSQLLQAADRAASEAGYHLIVTSDSRSGSASGTASLPVQFVDGLIALVPFPDSTLTESIESMNTALVLIESDAAVASADHIRIDNASGAAAATRHLLEGTPAARCFHVGGQAENYDTRERASAFARVLTEAGHEPRADQIRFGDFTSDWGYRWGMEMLKNSDRPVSAVFAGNDEIALGIVRAANTLGIEVPGSLRLVGFDGSRLGEVVRPSLSTVRVPLDAMGTSAVELCIDQIKNEEHEPRTLTLPTSLVIRESSAF